MTYKSILIIINIIHQFSNLVDANLTNTNLVLNNNQNFSLNESTSNSPNQTTSDNTYRNLFLAISLTSLFIYLLSLSMTDLISREKIPEVYNNKKIDKSSIILSKYLVKIVYGKWSSNFEFQNTLLNIEFNTQDPKLTSSSFSIPTIWLKKLMDHVGTKENPLLKAIKFWVFQPESLGLISTVKINLKDFKKTNSFIYIDSIELSKVSDDKIQVISITKNVRFTQTNQAPLNIELGFKQNTKVVPFDGYSPYFCFSDYFYFYIIYLGFGFLMNNLRMNWLENTEPSFMRMSLNCAINSAICTSFVILTAIFYLLFIRYRLSVRHNSETMQAINVIYLSTLFISIFVLNYLTCEANSTGTLASKEQEKQSTFVVHLLLTQIGFIVTLILLWILSKFFKYDAMKKMIAPASLEIQSGELKSDDKMINLIAKPQSDSNRIAIKRSSSTEKSKNLNKKSPIFAPKKVIVPVKKLPSPGREGSPVKRHDSDNSIGSGYYHQMITATKHVRSISQYGELLKDNKY